MDTTPGRHMFSPLTGKGSPVRAHILAIKQDGGGLVTGSRDVVGDGFLGLADHHGLVHRGSRVILEV